MKKETTIRIVLALIIFFILLYLIGFITIAKNNEDKVEIKFGDVNYFHQIYNHNL